MGLYRSFCDRIKEVVKAIKRVKSGVVLLVLLLVVPYGLSLFFPLFGSGDCPPYWRLDPSDTVEEYREASIYCRSVYNVSTAKCNGCLSRKHMEALEIGRSTPQYLLPDAWEENPYGRVMGCFEEERKRNENKKHSMGAIFEMCVVRETGMPID